jgi:hypothetical protein
MEVDKKIDKYLNETSNWNNKIMDDLTDILEILSSAPNFIKIKTNISSIDNKKPAYKELEKMVSKLKSVLVAFSKNM